VDRLDPSNGRGATRFGPRASPRTRSGKRARALPAPPTSEGGAGRSAARPTVRDPGPALERLATNDRVPAQEGADSLRPARTSTPAIRTQPRALGQGPRCPAGSTVWLGHPTTRNRAGKVLTSFPRISLQPRNAARGFSPNPRRGFKTVPLARARFPGWFRRLRPPEPRPVPQGPLIPSFNRGAGIAERQPG